MDFYLRHWLLYPISKDKLCVSVCVCVCAVYVMLVFWTLWIYQNIHTLCDAKRCHTKRSFFSVWLQAEHVLSTSWDVWVELSMFVFISTVWKAVDGSRIRAWPKACWTAYQCKAGLDVLVQHPQQQQPYQSFSHTHSHTLWRSTHCFCVRVSVCERRRKKQKTAHHHLVQCKFHVRCVRKSE